MPGFITPPTTTGGNFGKNEYLRSTKGLRRETYLISAASVPTETVDGDTTQKILQPGEAIAKITSGPEIGKYGPFQLGVTDGRQTVANLVGLEHSFQPWALHDGLDKEVGVTTHGVAVQAWCTIRDAGGARIVLTDAVADALRGGKRTDINFS